MGTAGFSSHLYKSVDEERTWAYHGVVARNSDQRVGFDEPSLVLVGSRILATLRTDQDPTFGRGFIYAAWSGISGLEWSTPVQLPVWGYPTHMLALRNGILLMTYGYRQLPYGVRYRVSVDSGRSWQLSWEGILESASETVDVGYPSSVELADGSILTVYYLTQRGRTYVKAVHYRIN